MELHVLKVVALELVCESDAELFDALESALADTREKLVILRGDKTVMLGRAVNILDVAQQAGATGIALATKPPGKKDS